MTPDDYQSAIEATQTQPDATHLRALVDIRCRENRRWLRDMFPEYPISFRAYQAIALPYSMFASDPELITRLKRPNAILVIEAAGILVVGSVPSN